MNILYVAITRARRLLVLNSTLRKLLENMGAWNSLSLRSVTGADGRAGRSVARGDDSQQHVKCSCCGSSASIGGSGGDPSGTTPPGEAGAATGRDGAGSGGRDNAGRAPGGDSRAGTEAAHPREGRDSRVLGLLYAASGTLGPLCRWCVEAPPATARNPNGLWLGVPGLPTFPYARTLIRCREPTAEAFRN